MKDCGFCCETPYCAAVIQGRRRGGNAFVGCTDPGRVSKVQTSVPATNIIKYSHHPGVAFDRSRHKSGWQHLIHDGDGSIYLPVGRY